jgi:ribose/xylose/arabinose/galactoside ABC-type transport system permease subunit
MTSDTNPSTTEDVVATNARAGSAPLLRTVGSALSRLGIFLALIVLSAAIAFLSPHFLKVTNLLNVLLQASINTIVALGMTFIITSGGIDLSVGSIVGLSGMVVADILLKGHGMPIGLLGGLVAGVILGFTNGALIAKTKLPPFIITLGSMSILRGLALIYNQGRPIYGLAKKDVTQVAGYLGAVPKPVIIAAIVAAIAWFVFRYTKIGEYAIAIGGNEEAARLSGINVNRYKVVIYSIGGMLCGLAGTVLTARLYAAEPIAGMGYELDAIAATVMGGTSLDGGEGTVVGTVIGAMIMSVLRNALNLLNVQSYYQQVVIGVVIVLAVVLDQIRKE